MKRKTHIIYIHTSVIKYRTRYIYNQNILNGCKQCNDSTNIEKRHKRRWSYKRAFKKNWVRDGTELFKCSDKRWNVCICAEIESGGIMIEEK